MGTATSFIGLMKTGALRAIGITSETRSAKFPEVPTFKESGFGDATFSIFVGLMGPVGLPPAIRAKLGEAMEAARNDKGLRERLDGIDQEISDVRTPEAFNAYMMSEEAKYAKVIKDANIKPE